MTRKITTKPSGADGAMVEVSKSEPTARDIAAFYVGNGERAVDEVLDAAVGLAKQIEADAARMWRDIVVHREKVAKGKRPDCEAHVLLCDAPSIASSVETLLLHRERLNVLAESARVLREIAAAR